LLLLQFCITPPHSQDCLQSGQTHRNTADSQDTATSGSHALPAASLRSAQTWSSGHLRTLASDAATAALIDPAVTRLDIQEGGVSPWKGNQVRHFVSQARSLNGGCVIVQLMCHCLEGSQVRCFCLKPEASVGWWACHCSIHAEPILETTLCGSALFILSSCLVCS